VAFAEDLKAARRAETDVAILERIERLSAAPQSVEPAVTG